MTQTEGPKKVLSKNRVREHLAKKRSECLNDQLPERLAEKRSEGAWRAFISERSNVPLATSAGPTFLLWGCTMHNWGEASQPEETTSHELRSSDWMFHAQALADRLRLEKRLESAEEALNAFAGRLTRLEKLCENSSSASVCVPISTLAPEPFDVIKNFYVVVQSEEDCYVATLFDANISSSGDSQEEAVANVIDLTVMIFRSLENEDDSKLGPAMVRQKHALQSLIRRS